VHRKKIERAPRGVISCSKGLGRTKKEEKEGIPEKPELNERFPGNETEEKVELAQWRQTRRRCRSALEKG